MSRFADTRSGTSRTILVHVNDTAGADLTTLVYNTAGLVAEYRGEGQTSWTAITLVSGTLGTWTSGGFVHDSNGDYELGLPNAAVALAGKWVAVRLRGASGMATARVLIPLRAVDLHDATAAGLSRLDVTVGSRSSHSAADVWVAATRSLTDKTGFSLLSPQAFNNTGQTTKVAATVATGDDADAASIKATIGAAGAGLTAVQYNGPTVGQIATQVEVQIMDETDTRTVLTAIVNKINSTDTDLAGLSVAAIADGVWTRSARTLTAGTNIVLAKGIGLTGLNDLDGFGVQTALTTQGYTTLRAGYLDKLNVAGTLAHIGNADSFKADVSGLLTSTGFSAVWTGSRLAKVDGSQQANSPVTLPPAPSGYGGGTVGGVPESGEVAVDHNTGGPNNLQYTFNRSPVEEGLVRAYLQSDYDAGNYAPQGETTTNGLGQWLTPMFLTPGETYVFTFEKPGQLRVKTKIFTIPG